MHPRGAGLGRVGWKLMRSITEAKDIHGKEKTLAVEFSVARDTAVRRATNGVEMTSAGNQFS